ncbi:hypothetical protein BJL83_23335 [Vibrio parahaemolyticus]|nr:hypothetical protein BJL83_23335 [Vibrio parahaemolyticus]
MTMTKFRQEIDSIVDEINSFREAPVVASASVKSQWERGNGSVVRTDTKNMATLSINRHDGFYGVGCDGARVGINEYLADKFTLHRHNSQNTRYRCSLTQLRAVIKYYASINA